VKRGEELKASPFGVDGKPTASAGGGIDLHDNGTASTQSSKVQSDFEDDEDDGATTDTSRVAMERTHSVDADDESDDDDDDDDETDTDISGDEDDNAVHMLSRMTIKMMHAHVREVAKRVPVELIRNNAKGGWERVPPASNQDQDTFSLFYSSHAALTADDSDIRACKVRERVCLLGFLCTALFSSRHLNSYLYLDLNLDLWRCLPQRLQLNK
jgi:hypothetical protein